VNISFSRDQYNQGRHFLARHGRLGQLLVTLIAGLSWSLSTNLAASERLHIGEWYDSQGRPVAESQLRDRLNEVDTLLLGEVHDARDVHRKQLELLEAVGQPVVLALEQLDLAAADPGAIGHGDLSGTPSARERAEQAGFDADGWGWEHYGGLFELATRQHWPLWGINLPRDQAMAVARSQEADWQHRLDANHLKVIKRVSPDLSLPSPQQESLLADLKTAHCGRVSGDLLAGMLRAQVARDILMANALADAHRAYPGHLIVGVMGNQHARVDRGVGYWLSRPDGADAGEVLSIGMLPIDTIDQLSKAAAAYGFAWDFVWIAPAVERDIDCGR